MTLPRRNWSQETFIKAYRFAAESHKGQLFPGTDLPYIMHVTFVCMEIIAGLDVEKERNGDLAVQCALLHDVIEDTPSTCEDVERAFGEDVALGVLALTKSARRLPTMDELGHVADPLRRHPLVQSAA